ncbi:MAG: prepilin peptidase [Mariprofundaceae bacterium]|nr:prepilin peptidase [Mariprofundaceae bacterium]
MNPELFLVLASGLFGLLFGSFSNVCVHRIPLRISIVSPRSRCPACEHEIAWYDNIPLISWLMLRGKCRSCGAPISIRYPLLELLMGLSWAGLAWKFGFSPLLIQALVMVSLLWMLTLIDLETGLLPNLLTFPGIAAGLLFSFWAGHLQDAIIGAVAGYAVFWLVAKLFLFFTGREGMGYGDFKLLAMLGAFMGWQALPFVIFASSLVGAVVGSAFILLTRKKMRAEIPFGPYLAAAGVVWFLWGGGILQWYAGLLRG